MHKAKHKEKMALFSGKRIAAFVLAFLLCVGTLPINSFAVEGDDMSQDAPAATEYVVDADISDPTADESFIEDEAPAGAADAQDDADGEQNEPATLAADASELDKLTLSHPRLIVDKNDATGTTFNANSSKGYMARMTISCTDDQGANGVWIGYRFTVKVPDGMGKNYLKFSEVSYNWLSAMDESGVATPTYDEATRTWILEGKYYYDDASNPLGSSGAKEYARSISLSSTWLEKGQTVTPTIEVWLVDKANAEHPKMDGETVTVDATGKILQRIDFDGGYPSAGMGCYYSPSQKKVFFSKAQANAAGATDAVIGRLANIGIMWSALRDGGNVLIPDGAEFPFSVKLTPQLNGRDVTDAAMQPILLGARFQNRSDTDKNGVKNAYTDNLADGDMTLGGRVSPIGSTFQNPIFHNITYSNNTISGVVGSEKTIYASEGYETGTPHISTAGFMVFVPTSANDTEKDVRKLKIENVAVPEGTVTMCGGVKNTRSDNNSGATLTIPQVKLDNPGWGVFNTTIKTVDRNGGDYNKVWVNNEANVRLRVVSVNTDDIDQAISAFDLLVKADTEGFWIDPTVTDLRSQTTNANGFIDSGGTLSVKFGVLPSGDGWTDRNQMLTTRKEGLTFYDKDSVPAGATIVAVLISGRGGNMLNNADIKYYAGIKVKDEEKVIGNVYDIVQDSYIWFMNTDPDKDAPDATKYCNQYISAVWDESGTEVTGFGEQDFGDSLLITKYGLQASNAENLNGSNKVGENRSTYDVIAGERTADVMGGFIISSADGKEAPNQEFYLNIAISRNHSNTTLVKDSVRLNATYTPGTTERQAGVFSGGIAPISVKEVNDADTVIWKGYPCYVYTFKVTGTGTYKISATYELGDALDPDKDVAVGVIDNVIQVNVASESSKILLEKGVMAKGVNFVITKSNVAGFRKLAANNAISSNGEAHYRMVLSPMDHDLTGTLLLDILPFNNDGRGTVLQKGSITVDKALELSITNANATTRTAMDLYYTTDAAIQQKNPLPTVADLKGVTASGDSFNALGVTWQKATRTNVDDTHVKYTVDKHTVAIMGAGHVGQNESPNLDIYLQLHDTMPGDGLSNTASFNANEFGKPMITGSVATHIADRVIKGKAWIDANNNGKQDAGEKGLAGLTVKLYQGGTEITQDELGNTYNVVTADDGTYTFEYVPSSADSYHVEFSSGSISRYAVSPKAASGVADDKNSDVTGDPATGRLVKAVSDEVTLLTLTQQGNSKIPHDEKQLDAGFAPKYTVRFDTNGGTPNIDDQTVVAHDKVAKPADPAKVDQVFAGWYYTDADGNEKQWSFDDPVTADLVLKAKWVDATAATLEVKGTKTLTGGGKTNTDIAADQFKFTVTRTDNGTASAVSGLPTTTIGTKAGAANGAEIDFGTWSFTKSGTYTFTVSEETPAAGYTKAGDVTISVVVTQNGDKLVATMTPADITFANTYTYPDDIKDTVSGSVKLADKDGNDKAFNDGDFSVKIAENATNDTTGYTGFTAGDKDVSADGSFSLDEISFSKAGTYKFTVTQNDKGEAGYTYDDASYEVTVTVELDEATNTLKKTVSYTKNGADVTEIIFNNVYTEYSVSFDTDGGTPNIDDQAIPSGEKATKPTDPTKADSVFAGWYYTDADGNEKQWSFDDPVTADLALKAKWVDATAATLDVEGVKLLIADKHGNHDIEADQFKFTVKQTSGNTAAVSGLPTAAVGTKAGEGLGAKIDFGTWVFKKAGTYTFVLSEEEPGAGYTKAEDVTVTVTVRQNGDELVATMTTPNSIRFINHYEEAEPIRITIPVSVTLKDENGNDMPFTEGDFTANVEVDRLNTGTKHDSKTGDFSPDGTLNINQGILAPDVYVYTITQQDKGAAGYTYDDSIFVATITVTLDKATNTLQKTVTYTKNGQPVDKLEFNNTYTSPDAITDTTIGSVTLKDEDGNDKTFNDGDFSVKIVANDANDTTGYTGFVAGDKDVAADGSFSFDEISFGKAGTYKFTVTQNDKGAAGYTYDDASYEVTVTVELDKATNTLKKTITYTKDGVEVTEVVFNNTYATPAPSDITFSGNKTLKENGVDKAMEEGQFSFTIAADASNDATGYTGFIAGSQDVASNGSFSFGTVRFTKVGVYKFTISEVDKGAAGYHYDANAVTVTVTVELDTATNTLVATATYEKAGETADGIAFANTYDTPDAVDQDLTGNVSLDGDRNTSDIKAGDFTFKVTPDAGNDESGYTLPNTAAASKDGGDIDFSKITFTKEGTYKFTVSQDNLGKEGYTYDDATYVVTVTVTLDKATNKLVPVIKLEKVKDGVTTAVDAISFANSYKAVVNPTKPSNAPQTGDTTHVAAWGGLLLVSICGLIILFIVSWKRKKTSNTK